MAIKAQGDSSGITGAQIKEKISETQTASLSLFQKVRFSFRFFSFRDRKLMYFAATGLREEGCRRRWTDSGSTRCRRRQAGRALFDRRRQEGLIYPSSRPRLSQFSSPLPLSPTP